MKVIGNIVATYLDGQLTHAPEIVDSRTAAEVVNALSPEVRDHSYIVPVCVEVNELEYRNSVITAMAGTLETIEKSNRLGQIERN